MRAVPAFGIGPLIERLRCVTLTAERMRGWLPRRDDRTSRPSGFPLAAFFLSGSERLLQNAQGAIRRTRINATEPSNQPIAVNGPDLVEHQAAVPAAEAALHAERAGVADGRHRCDDAHPQKGVRIVGRDSNTGAGLVDLPTQSRVRIDKVHVATHWCAECHHRQPSSSKRVGVESSSIPDAPCSRSARAASALPARVAFDGKMVMAPSRTRSSTSSTQPASSIRGFGRRIPREFPTLTRRVFVRRLPRDTTMVTPEDESRTSPAGVRGTARRWCPSGADGHGAVPRPAAATGIGPAPRGPRRLGARSTWRP